MSGKEEITRRDFLLKSGCVLCACGAAGGILPELFYGDVLAKKSPFKKIASHWESIGNKRVRCSLCPNECILDEGDRGACRVRENDGGKLYTLVYSRLATMHVDPVEKKPLNHFMPGSMALSVATAGCNLSCKFCQNWQLSQSAPEDLRSIETPPGSLVRKAVLTKSPVIAFTYNEPTVQYEYIVDASKAAKKRGIKPVIISNGYINPVASKGLVENLDGVKIDFKGFSEKFYRDVCGGHLKDVQNNLETVFSTGKWLETVTLVIPTLNDSPAEIRNMARWVKKNLSADIPMHFTRFHSTYLIKNLPPTPVSTLERCREIAVSEGIKYAYVGNVPGHKWENTYCPKCGAVVIKRGGFFAVRNLLDNGRCPECKMKIPGVWK